MTTTPTAVDPGIEARVYRKVTLKIMPLLMLGMFISYIDRANLGVIAGPLSKDLGLTAATFGLAAGFFYIAICCSKFRRTCCSPRWERGCGWRGSWSRGAS
ncbi:putative tartrate transporter [Arthrobacter sp. Hiyo6]|nr:putative tartrate transporter [Arthrobacter sp. Hiyo6]